MIYKKSVQLSVILIPILFLFGLPLRTASMPAPGDFIYQSSDNLCKQTGYWINSYNHPVELTGRLIGIMVSGEEIGLETVLGSQYPVFQVHLGENLNINKIISEVEASDTILVKGYWQGVDCQSYRAIFGFSKYANSAGEVCVPQVEAEEIYQIEAPKQYN